jgi:hypothetical protein
MGRGGGDGGVHGGGLSSLVKGLLGVVGGARHRVLLEVGGPIPPFTFYRCGFRLSCDADLGKPLHRDRIVINREGESSPLSGGRTLSTGPRFEGVFEAAAISGAARR